MENPNTKVALDAGAQLAILEGRHGVIADIPVALVPAGMTLKTLEGLLDEQEKRATKPSRRTGTAVLHELESFVKHVQRFKDDGSIVYADSEQIELTAVLNYHKAGAAADPRWGDHRAIYVCPLSVQWKTWKDQSGKWMSQDDIGQHIEDNMADLAAPTPADVGVVSPAKLLETTRNLIIRSKGEFSRSINPSTGEFSVVNKTEHETTSTPIPKTFLLGIPVFEAGVLYRVEARFRFNLNSGRPQFAYELVTPHLIVKDAFQAVRQEVISKTGLEVLAGHPEPTLLAGGFDSSDDE